MAKKKTVKPKAIRNLGAKGLTAKASQAVKGGYTGMTRVADEIPSERLAFNFGKLTVKSKPQ